MIDLKTKNVTEITSYFSDAVNNLSFHPKKIAEEQKESREMRELDIFWIKILSSQDYSTDLRNEASAQTAGQLAKIPFIREQMELVHNKKDGRGCGKTFSGTQDFTADFFKSGILSSDIILQ